MARDLAQASKELFRRTEDEMFPDDYTKKAAKEAVRRAFTDPGPGLALSVWGIVQGLTSLAREVPLALERTRMEQRAGRLLREAAKDQGVPILPDVPSLAL